ncbi:hypothetical protein HK097_006956 [Rhizophlyctis rosea]|uniref:NADP-dependent oxidoreductase domain-containing protein n=1 Tax=Rhizophlyctis rosea TaxID=64517 RepID=A0AAD5X1X9_9FUNG|nr:hypothetical protein HK097_006956 [Rhizophlyctis rosea]
MVAVNEQGEPTTEYVRFGNTGLYVSRIALGFMSYGSKQWAEWVLERDEAFPIIEKAWKAGINFWDTANTYSNGESERILGEALKKFNIPRDQIVIATKVFSPAPEDYPGLRAIGHDVTKPPFTNRAGLSRKHIFDAVDASLRRLGTDYIDLYQIHRWDYNTPIEETMEALNDLVRLGKVRYIGASSMHAWQFAKAQAVAEKHGWTKFISMQNFYNVIYREEEREMLPFCHDSGVAVIPWSPLARGVLTATTQSVRSTTDPLRVSIASSTPKHVQEAQEKIASRVSELAKKYSATNAQIALAWLYTKPYVTSPIVGINKERYIDDLLGAQKVKLSEEDAKWLEELYVVQPIVGHK